MTGRQSYKIIFISGLPCSGKSHFCKRLVKHLGHEKAVRLPADHYYLDATHADHRDVGSITGYHRDRLNWSLFFSHLDELMEGKSIETPRYDWESFRRVAQSSGIGRSSQIEPRPFIFVDSFNPSLQSKHTHIYIAPNWSIRRELIEIRSSEMPLPENYEGSLRRLEGSSYKEDLRWLSQHSLQTVEDPINLKLSEFCLSCGFK